MPTFQDFAPAYAAAGIVPLPLGGEDGKRPLVKRPGTFGRRAAMELAANPKFADANLGFWCGAHNRLTVVDVDSTADAELQHAIDKYGDSPVIVRTGSGKGHLYYRHDGERRSIRPDKAHPIDVLGAGGLCVAPPSIRPSGGRYEFLRGGLSDIANRNLPKIRGGALQFLENRAKSFAAIDRGHRGEALFRMAVELSHSTETLADLLGQLREANATLCNPPLSDAEVHGRVRSAWKYKTTGVAMARGVSNILLPMAPIARWLGEGDLDPLALLTFIRKSHSSDPGKVFAASPAGMAQARCIGSWDKHRYRASIRKLCDAGEIEQVHKGGRGPHDPDLYRLPSKGGKAPPNHNQTLPLSPQRKFRGSIK